MVSEPLIDAHGMVAMLAGWQDLHLVTILEHTQAYTALGGLPAIIPCATTATATRRRRRRRRRRRHGPVQHNRQALDGFGGEPLAPRRRGAVAGVRVDVEQNERVTARPPGVEDDDGEQQDEREEHDDEEQGPSVDLEVVVVQIRVVPVELVRIVVHLFPFFLSFSFFLVSGDLRRRSISCRAQRRRRRRRRWEMIGESRRRRRRQPEDKHNKKKGLDCGFDGWS